MVFIHCNRKLRKSWFVCKFVCSVTSGLSASPPLSWLRNSLLCSTCIQWGRCTLWPRRTSGLQLWSRKVCFLGCSCDGPNVAPFLLACMYVCNCMPHSVWVSILYIRIMYVCIVTLWCQVFELRKMICKMPGMQLTSLVGTWQTDVMYVQTILSQLTWSSIVQVSNLWSCRQL